MTRKQLSENWKSRKQGKDIKAKGNKQNTLIETDHVSRIALEERCERCKGLGVDRVVLVVMEAAETVGILLATRRVTVDADVLVQVVGARESLRAVLDWALECWNRERKNMRTVRVRLSYRYWLFFD